MACESPRAYIPLLRYEEPPIPAVPTSLAWRPFRDFLLKLKEYLENRGRNQPLFNFTFSVESFTGGIRLSWSGAHAGPKRALAYNIYRSSTRNFQAARIIYTAHRGNSGDLFSFFDKNGRTTPGADVYYWMEAFNESIVTGPIQGPVVTQEP